MPWSARAASKLRETILRQAHAPPHTPPTANPPPAPPRTPPNEAWRRLCDSISTGSAPNSPAQARTEEGSDEKGEKEQRDPWLRRPAVPALGCAWDNPVRGRVVERAFARPLARAHRLRPPPADSAPAPGRRCTVSAFDRWLLSKTLPRVWPGRASRSDVSRATLPPDTIRRCHPYSIRDWRTHAAACPPQSVLHYRLSCRNRTVPPAAFRLARGRPENDAAGLVTLHNPPIFWPSGQNQQKKRTKEKERRKKKNGDKKQKHPGTNGNRKRKEAGGLVHVFGQKQPVCGR